MTNKNYKQSGFTLVETLVAITILMIAIVGPISIIGDAIHKSYYAKDQIIAINLAQEGIEVVRQKRDSNMLVIPATVGGWVNGLDAEYYLIDAVGAPSVIMTACTGACITDLKPIYLDTEGLYRQAVGLTVATQFSRIVKIQAVTGNLNERKVTSTVNWRTGGGRGSVSVSEHLFKTF